MKLFLKSTLPLLLATSVLAQNWLPKSDEPLSEQPEGINWLPLVWDDDQKPAELKQIERNPVFNAPPNPILSLFPIRPQLNLGPCDAPNGMGMRNLFQQAKALLPLERIRAIILGAAQDPELQALNALVHSPEYRRRIQSLGRSRAYKGYRDYACYKMNCDLKLYADFIRSLLQLSVLTEQQPRNGTEVAQKGRPGLHGILQDIRDALPRQRLRDLFESLMRSDWYLMRAVQRASSYEFEAIFKVLQRNPDYKYLQRAQAEVGMSVEELKNLIYYALGWRDEGQNPTDNLLIDS